MVILFAGALPIGMAASFMIPLLPFICVVLIADLIMTMTMAVQGYGLGQIFIAASALLVIVQVGYGLGMILNTILRPLFTRLRRTMGRADQQAPQVQPFSKL